MDSKKLIADVSKCFNESIDRSEGVILCYLEGPDCAPFPCCYQHMDDFEEAKKLCDQMNRDHVNDRKYAVWDKSLSEQFYPPVESKRHRDDEYHLVLHDDGTPKGKPVAIFATITGDLDRAKKACKLHNASSKRHFMTVRTLLDNGEFSEPLFPIGPKDFPKRFRETNEAAEEKPEAYAVCRVEDDTVDELARFRTFERAKNGCNIANRYSEKHPGAFTIFAIVNGKYGKKVYPETVNENEEPDYENFDDYEEFIDQAKDGAFDGYRIITTSIEDGWGGLRLLLKDEDNNLLEVFVKNHDLKDADAWLTDCGRRNIDGVITHTDEETPAAVEYTIALCAKPNEPPCKDFGTIDDLEQAKKIVDYMNVHGKHRKEGVYGVYTIHNNEYSKMLYPTNMPEVGDNGAPINEKAMYELNWPEQYNHDVLGQLAKHSDLKNKFEQTSDHSIKFAHDDNLKQQFIDYLKAEKCDEKDLMINEINESKDEMCEINVSPHLHLDAQKILNADPEIKSKIEWTAINAFKFEHDDELLQKITDALVAGGIPKEEFMAQELDEAVNPDDIFAGVINHLEQLGFNYTKFNDNFVEFSGKTKDINGVECGSEGCMEVEDDGAVSFSIVFFIDEKETDGITGCAHGGPSKNVAEVVDSIVIPNFDVVAAIAETKVNEAQEDGENDLDRLTKCLEEFFKVKFEYAGRWGRQIEFDTESSICYRDIDEKEYALALRETMGDTVDPDFISIEKHSVTVGVTDKFNDGVERFDISTITKENMPEILKFDELKELVEDAMKTDVRIYAVDDKKFEIESKNVAKEAGILSDLFKELQVASGRCLITNDPKTGKLNAYVAVKFVWEFKDHGFNGHEVYSAKFEDGKWQLKSLD